MTYNEYLENQTSPFMVLLAIVATGVLVYLVLRARKGVSK